MMFRKALAVLAALTALAALSGCASGTPEETTPADTSASVTEETAADLTLFDGTSSDYVIVRGEKATNTEIDAAMRLRNALKERGVTLKITTDWEGNGVFPHEIVVGETTRTAEEGNDFDFHTVGPNGYFLRASGERLYIGGGSAGATALAVEEFITEFLTGEGTLSSLRIPADYEKTVREEFAVTALTIGGTPVSEFALRVETKDAKGKTAARAFQEELYARLGCWLPVLARDDAWDGPAIVLRDGAASEAGALDASVEGGDLVVRTDVAGAFRRGILSMLYDWTDGKSGEIALGADYRYSDPVASYVLYSDFGAKGDGVTNDIGAIVRAHAEANKTGARVRADRGATYYIGAADSGAVVQTDTDWTGASFLIDDSGVPLEKRSVAIFNVTPKAASVSAAGLTSLRAGQENIGLKPGVPAVVLVTNDKVRRYIRLGLNQDSGFVQSEVFLVDADGNVDPTTPIQWDYDTITSVKILPANEETLTLTGGTFTTVANTQPSNGSTFYTRGISITRSNVVLDGMKHYVTGEGTDGAPYFGILFTQNCANITVKNCTFTAHKLYYNIGSAGQRVGQGTYDISPFMTMNLTFENCTQTTDILDSAYWGIIATNGCKNITLDGCNFSRFDAHRGAWNVTIKNSTLGYQGINMIGGGTMTVENSTVYGKNFVDLRLDYGSTWDGDLIIRNCTWYPNQGKAVSGTVTLIGGSYDTLHDFGYECYMPHTITIDGLTVMDTKASGAYRGVTLLSDFVPGNTSPNYDIKMLQAGKRLYHLTTELTIRGFAAKSGKDWILCPNTYLFRDLVIHDLDA